MKLALEFSALGLRPFEIALVPLDLRFEAVGELDHVPQLGFERIELGLASLEARRHFERRGSGLLRAASPIGGFLAKFREPAARVMLISRQLGQPGVGRQDRLPEIGEPARGVVAMRPRERNFLLVLRQGGALCAKRILGLRRARAGRLEIDDRALARRAIGS